MKHFLLSLLLLSGIGASAQITFNYTGDLDSLQIPNCVDSIMIEVYGAQGADAPAGGTGGLGGSATGYLSVSAGDWIYINVGGQDGYNGGGIGGVNGFTDFSGTVDPDAGGNGGGASDVRVGGKTLGDRVIVAGGGGGGGHQGVWPSCQPAQPAGVGGVGGDAGNGTEGTSAACNCTNGGGTFGGGASGITAGLGGGYNAGGCGTAGPGYNANGADGVLGIGGDGSVNYYNGTGGGGGGGGGYYGGGAGGSGWDTTPGGGGGGGSSYVGGVVDSTMTSGTQTGDGMVVITYMMSSSGLDVSVTVSGFTLNAVSQANVTYQWLNCNQGNAAITGATNVNFSPGANGSYAVELTDTIAGCTDTSACQTIAGVGVDENDLFNVKVYPNPATDVAYIALDNGGAVYQINITDVNGKLVFEGSSTDSLYEIDMTAFENGVYLIRINSDEVSTFQQLIKQ